MPKFVTRQPSAAYVYVHTPQRARTVSFWRVALVRRSPAHRCRCRNRREGRSHRLALGWMAWSVKGEAEDEDGLGDVNDGVEFRAPHCLCRFVLNDFAEHRQRAWY